MVTISKNSQLALCYFSVKSFEQFHVIRSKDTVEIAKT